MSSVKSIKNPGGHSKTMTKAGGLVLIRWKEGHLETENILMCFVSFFPCVKNIL